MLNSLRNISRSLSTLSPRKLPKISHTPSPYRGPSKEDVLESRRSFLNPGMFLYYKDPIMVVQGWKQYVYDEKGRRYLDFLGGIVTVSVGHAHPKVVKACVDQLNLISHTTTIYLNPVITEYAKKLAETMPSGLNTCYFVNSGSEANELAMLMARLTTGNYEMVGLRHCYHGMTTAAMGLTAQSNWKYHVPQGFGIVHALNPDKYRGIFGNDVDKYVWDLKNLIESSTSGKVAGFIAESIQGVNGTVEFVDGYLPKAYEIIRSAGGVCIADEVQTGFGRTGTKFWGFQNYGITPDIVVMAKGIGNGAPLAAVVTTSKIAQTLKDRLHFNTYGGNPVSMAAANATLDVIKEENLQENSLIQGNALLNGFNKLKSKYDIIGDVRGKGLMLGIELVLDRKTKEPAPIQTAAVFEKLKDFGLLVGKGGRYGNVLRIKPPMCINSEDVEYALGTMEDAFKQV